MDNNNLISKVINYLNLQYQITEIKAKLILAEVLTNAIILFIIILFAVLTIFTVLFVIPFIFIFIYKGLEIATLVIVSEFILAGIIFFLLKNTMSEYLRDLILKSIEKYEGSRNIQ